jgi:TRAP-type C4-dicarboxylate transport system permease small subunit
LHPRIDAISQLLPVKIRIIVENIIMVFVIALLIDFLLRGWSYTWTSGLQKHVGMFDFNYVYVYMALPVGFGLMLLRVLQNVIKDTRELMNSSEVDSSSDIQSKKEEL